MAFSLSIHIADKPPLYYCDASHSRIKGLLQKKKMLHTLHSASLWETRAGDIPEKMAEEKGSSPTSLTKTPKPQLTAEHQQSRLEVTKKDILYSKTKKTPTKTVNGGLLWYKRSYTCQGMTHTLENNYIVGALSHRSESSEPHIGFSSLALGRGAPRAFGTEGLRDLSTEAQASGWNWMKLCMIPFM